MPRVPKNTTPIRTVGARIKKVKIVFDPSVNNLRKKRISTSTCSAEDLLQVQKPRKGRLLSANQNITYPISASSESPPVLEPQVSNGTDTCVICEKLETKKNKKLIPCKDCNYKVHPGCLKINFQNPDRVEERWRCNNCKTCIVCDETREAGYLIICSVCVDAYHYNCHTPPLQRSKINKSKWECYKCSNIVNQLSPNKIIENKNRSSKKNKVPMVSTVSSPSSSITNISSARLLRRIRSNDSVKAKKIVKLSNEDEESLTFSSLNHQLQSNQTDIAFIRYHKLPSPLQTFFETAEEIPDITDWSCEKIANYIEKYLPDEAKVFREQEIDGLSCLLLKRSDVVNGLSLKLGPALRLYCIITALQTRRRSVSLTWM